MKFIEGKNKRYLLKNETLKECDIGDYFLQEENNFIVNLCYNNGNDIKVIEQYTKEYSKKVPIERMEQIIKKRYD